MKKIKRTGNRIIAVFLAVMMLLPLFGINAFMVDSSAYNAAMTEARSFIDGLTVNSSANVPSNVVSTFGSQFSWDNEKRETNNKAYLFEWSYYNGVVFEGLQYLYEAEKDTKYLDYVTDYMSAMISSNGGWAKTTNNSSKDAAGYVDYHGADCYKTASLLMNLALKDDGTVDTSSKYYKMATTIYSDLTTGTGSNYIESSIGGNYWHSGWTGSAPTYKVWLDGIYMIQPFLAEYAYYTDDTAQLDKIVERFEWIYTNMRETGTGLYYHAANSNTNYVNYHWTRAIGWYAMAVVDVMQYMSGENLAIMSTILKDLVDNMLPYQDSATGMWANLCDKNVSNTNRLETSGTSMLAYTIAKAVNNGWLESSYLEYAKNAFTGMTENKLSNGTLSDIYFKASATGANNYETSSYYYSNEGKGFGPYIMAYSELLKSEKNEIVEPNPEPSEGQVYTVTVAIPNGSAEVESIDDVNVDVTVGEKIDLSGMSFTVHYADGTTGNFAIPADILDGTNYTTDKAETITFNVVNSNTNSQVGKIVATVKDDTIDDYNNLNWAYVEGVQYTPVTIYLKRTGTLTDGKSYLIGYTSNNSGGVINSSAQATSVTSKASGKTQYYDENGIAYTASAEYIVDADGSLSNCVWTRNGGQLYNASSGKYLTRNGGSAVAVTTNIGTFSWSFGNNLIYTNYRWYNRYVYYTSSKSFAMTTSQSYIYGYEPVTVYEKTGSSEGGGYYALAKKLTYEIPLGLEFDVNDIYKETEIVYSKTGTSADVQVIDWNDERVTYKLSNTVDTSAIGSYTMTVMVDGTEIGNIRISVAENNYPDYPQKGSVSIDKSASGEHFKETGVADVELTVKGVPTSAPIDVVFVTDVSNSMAWQAGTTTFNTANSKMKDLQAAVAGFANTYLSDTRGIADNNTISLATFGGLDKDYLSGTLDTYTDATRTLLVGSDSKTDVINTINNITYTVSSDTVYLTFDGSTPTGTDITNGTVTADTNYGNTNYDYAFMETSNVISTLKSQYYTKTGISYDESGRSIYVIMLTDGAPTNYEGIYYNSRMSTSRPDGLAQWINASGTKASYTVGNNSSQSTWYNYISSTKNTWATKVYNTESVVGMTAIGFDLANGGFSNWVFTESAGTPLTTVLQNMVDGATVDVHTADDAETLATTLREKAEALAKNNTNAYVIDNMGSQYDLQMASTVNCNIVDSGKINLSDFNITPKIQVLSYDVYTRGELGTTVNGVKVTVDKIGQRKGTDPTYYETVTFNEDGTEAYSDQLEGNIMTDGVIYAQYFTYNSNKTAVTLSNGTTLAAETFNWKIGDIPEDEIILRYNVYLNDSMEGGRDAGVYNTNDAALLYYINFLGNNCQLEFPIPSLPWEKAQVSYELYLVNQKGQPVDLSGNVVSFENRVLMSDLVTAEKFLNTRETIDIEELEQLLPDGYGLFNPDSSYTVTIGSGKGMSSAKIIDDKYATTVVFDPANGTVGTDGSVALDDYTATKVAFAIVKPSVSPDVVVIDYGKTIHVTTFENDMGAYRTIGIGNIDSVGTALSKSYKTECGTFTVSDREVYFTPTKYLSSIQRVKYSVSAKTEKYPVTDPLSSHLSVIPATTVYYEDNFGGEESDGGLYIKYTGDWYTATDDGTITDGVAANTDMNDRQDNGEIGVGNTPYGYDSSYNDDIKFSNGSAAKVTGTISKVDGNPVYDATAEFVFTGTGFDLISRTDIDCGMIAVTITDAAGTVKTVPVINKGVNTLYQIPVISYTGLDYGTYTVRINVCAPVAALKITGSVFYLDAIRIYDPMGQSSSDNVEFDEANSAYAADKEANAFVSSIRDYIIQAGQLDVSETFGAVYVDTLNNQYTEGGLLDQDIIQNFELVGPNEEVYLSPGYGVGFILEASQKPESVQLEIKVPAPLNNGATLSAQTYGKNNIVNFNVTSATEMFYDISDAVNFEVSSDGKYRATVILSNGLPTTNLGEIISITNVKMTFANGVQAYSEDEISTASVIDDNAAVCALKASWSTYEDVYKTVDVQHKASLPEEHIASAESLNLAQNGGKIKAVIKTSRYVDNLVINNPYGKSVKLENVTSTVDESKILTEDYKSAKTWNVEFTAYGANGIYGYSVTTDNGCEPMKLDVEIRNPEVTSVRVVNNPNKTVYSQGDRFDPTGLTLLVSYSDGTQKTIKSGYTYNTSKLNETGKQKIAVTYGGVSVYVTVSVRSPIAYAFYSLFARFFRIK